MEDRVSEPVLVAPGTLVGGDTIRYIGNSWLVLSGASAGQCARVTDGATGPLPTVPVEKILTYVDQVE